MADRIVSASYAHPDAIRPYFPLRVRRLFRDVFVADPEARAHPTALGLHDAIGDLSFHAEWILTRREGYELSRDGRRTGVRFEAAIRERPRKGDWESTISKGTDDSPTRRLTGVPPYHGTKKEARHRLELRMRSLTAEGKIERR